MKKLTSVATLMIQNLFCTSIFNKRKIKSVVFFMKAFCSMKIRIKDLSLSMLPEQGLAVVPGQCRDPGPVPQILMIGTGTQSHGTAGTRTKICKTPLRFDCWGKCSFHLRLSEVPAWVPGFRTCRPLIPPLYVQGFPEGNKIFEDNIDFIIFFTSEFKHQFFR